MRQVVVTGSGGLVGGVLMKGLRGRYELRGLDRRRGEGVDRRVRMTRPRAVQRAFAGADVVVDLAARPEPDLPWKDAYANNIASTWNVLQAAVDCGVRRVVFASSNHVTGGYEEVEPYAAVVAGRYDGLDPATLPRITPAYPDRPDGAYGVSKAFGEAAGRYFADAHGLSVICLRIGSVNRADRPGNVRALSTLLTHRDLVQLVERCIEAPEDVRYAILYGVSGNTWRIWDIEEARRLVGYEPLDDAERWREAAAG